jgi:ubiquitin thioesterase protein OTUB1
MSVMNTSNDAEIAAALAAVEEADAAALLASASKGDDDGGDVSSSSKAEDETAAPTTQPPPPFERPTDEQIVAQENEIRAAIAGSAALIGKREPLSALRDEYRGDDDASSVFAAKAEALSKRYRALRRARGDGNCFFRSFMFALAEGLLERGDLAERNR